LSVVSSNDERPSFYDSRRPDAWLNRPSALKSDANLMPFFTPLRANLAKLPRQMPLFGEIDLLDRLYVDRTFREANEF
jgi:hypothetical protein